MVRIQVKPIIPKAFDSSVFVDEIAKAQRAETKPKLKALFAETVSTWKHKPTWEDSQTIKKDYISMFVYAAGRYEEQYGYVSKGTRDHLIAARNVSRLRFQRGYVAATRPGRLRATSARRFGEVITPTVVHHPGIKARDFPELVAKEHLPDFEHDMQAAANRAALKI